VQFNEYMFSKIVFRFRDYFDTRDSQFSLLFKLDVNLIVQVH
jgi:hypothetical protein